MAIGERVFIYSTFVVRLDLFNFNTRHIIERIHTDFVIKVTDVTNDGLILHLRHVVCSDDTIISSRCDVDVTPA